MGWLALEAAKFAGQGVVSGLEPCAVELAVLVGQPDEEARSVVVVA